MAISSPVARQICTKSELELFSESLSCNIGKLDTKALKSRVGRARKLRDKYHQRANRQNREARGKQTPRRSRPAQGSAQTRKKEQLFAETLDRFDKQLAKLESPKPKRVVKKTKKRATAKVATSRTAARKPASTKKATTAAKPARKKASGRTRIEKHLSAQNQRKQARRDAR